MLDKGWQCPGCDKCYAPFVSRCATCGVSETKITINPTVQMPSCEHQWGTERTTLGRLCILCGTQEVIWEQPGNTSDITKVTEGGTNG